MDMVPELPAAHRYDKTRIDVCIVTKERARNYSNVIQNVPVNNVIIETSTPLGLARMKAIQKVETEWFAFIDDDIELAETWFETISSYIREDVGAIQGIGYVRGLGEKWDRDLNVFRLSRYLGELRLGDRGMTHNTLIRTKLVKDWKPSRMDLSAWEDHEITQHILKKGYRWLVVPAKAYHTKSWRTVFEKAVWSVESWKKINTKKSWFVRAVKSVGWVFSLLLDWVFPYMPWRVRIYLLLQGLGGIWGLLKR